MTAFACRTEKNHETLGQHIRSPGRDLNPGPIEYESEVLTIRRNVSQQFWFSIYSFREPGSSVSIVSGYGLDDRATEVDPRQRRKDFPLTSVQTGSGAHLASCTMGTGGPFRGAKAQPGRDADHSPHLGRGSKMSRSYTSSLPKRLHGVW
jgi:hypothetical protein